jgi:hypothetical protein
MIGPAGFDRNLRQSKNEFFTTSLYEIDRILQERKEQAIELEDEIDYDEHVKKVLPREYWPYKDVFSKANSDKLPPH